MLNKLYKKFLNKYFRFFEFIFFLRYLLIIFFISIAVFLTIPIFFDYEKKISVIKSHLKDNYNFIIKDYEKIEYKIFPTPNLELINVRINFKSNKENLNVNKVIINPSLLSIYNFENFNSNKLTLKNSDIIFQISNFSVLIKQLLYKKKKLFFDNLNLRLVDGNIPVITLNNIRYANFGYDKNLIKGKVFNKNFKVEIDNNFKNINLKLLKSGMSADIKFEDQKKQNIKLGIFKSKILNTNFKSNFEYDGKIIKIYNSFFRSNFLSFKNEGNIVLNPSLDINSNFFIEEFNASIFKKIDLNEVFKFKELIRKINAKTEINYKSKKFNPKFFDKLFLKLNFAYGRMNYSKKLINENNTSQCDGSVNFLEDYPLLSFNCIIELKNKKEFLKKFSVKTKNENNNIELKVKGNLSMVNRKVNFKKISLDDNYKASKEDLKYFKDAFEKILFNENFFEIFHFKKIREFIIEIT